MGRQDTFMWHKFTTNLEVLGDVISTQQNSRYPLPANLEVMTWFALDESTPFICWKPRGYRVISTGQVLKLVAANVQAMACTDACFVHFST